MRVIVGLRNPETRYRGTRHNIGEEVVEMLVSRWGWKLRRGPRGVKAQVAVGRRDDRAVVVALPKTYMNVSGPAVASLLAYFDAEPSELLVIHDDIDLPFGRLRVHFGRGTGGHNGIRSVVASLGSREFWRLKVGVGRPPGRMDPAAYVLQRFDAEERPEVDRLVQDAADVAEVWLDDTERAIQRAGERA